MQKKDDSFILSAGDLTGFLNCKRLTELDTLVANHKLKAPEFKNPHLEVMQQRGFEHENNYIQHLQALGLTHECASGEEGEDAYAKTIELMRRGVDIITQGVLKLEGWYGRSDVLKKISVPSNLGEFSYIVMDTKLSRETKAGSIMQLCLYSEMVKEIQGIMPEHMYVVTPDESPSFKEEKYRVDDYQAFYRLVRHKLLEALGHIEAYPEPVSYCDVCRWWESCSQKRRVDDHLSLVANITRSQRRDLEGIEVRSMQSLAKVDLEEFKRLPAGTNVKSLELAREQARVQVEAKEKGEPVCEFLPFEEGRGLSRLPEPNEGDLFFDIEGDTFVGRYGLEYLLGVTFFDDGEQKYKGIWATKPKAEKAAFKELMEFILERMKVYPEFHIYHYAHYEPSAIKKLAQKHSIYEEEVDHLLRANKFIDLYGVVRQGIRASVEKYSIKDLEIFTGYERKIGLNEMISHKRALEHHLELSRFDEISDKMREAVQLYNQDDTDSTYALRQWLEEKRAKAIEGGNEILRPQIKDGTPLEKISERDQRLDEIKDALIKDIDFDLELSTEEKVRVILGDLVSFYRREQKVASWEMFRLMEMSEDEILEDKSGIAGLTLLKRIPPSGRVKNFSDIYSYPYQEVDFKNMSELFEVGGLKIGSLDEINPYERTIQIKKTEATQDLHPTAIYGFSYVPTLSLENSLIKFCEEIIENGMEGDKYKAVKDLLLHKLPDSEVPIVVPEGGEVLVHAQKIVESLKCSYLPIQGPPGAGKSYTGSRLIYALLKKGKKVGVCATGHKVINGLLTSTKKLVGEEFTIMHKVKNKTDDYAYSITTKYKDCDELVSGAEPLLLGGTSWLFARDEMEETLDYLFVDEGGQLSLANLISISRAAKNLVILGDCQQLEQPIQASHHEGVALSALEYIQGEQATIPPERGLFLEKTFRLHPEICRFNSELFYEKRLHSTKGNEGQVVVGAKNLRPLMFKEVFHQGNTNYSIEEVNCIYNLVKELIDSEHTFSLLNHNTQELETKRLSLQDIMVIAPYNAQVQRLKDKLPEGIEVGTVDKFQGREAPVVIYSVTTSSAEDAPRGMDFLYSQSRLNVASSRAQCSFIMVANKDIFFPGCKSPAQMKLANAYCRFLEMAENYL